MTAIVCSYVPIGCPFTAVVTKRNYSRDFNYGKSIVHDNQAIKTWIHNPLARSIDTDRTEQNSTYKITINYELTTILYAHIKCPPPKGFHEK